MVSIPRIAVVSAQPTDLTQQVGAVAAQPRVERFQDLCLEAESIFRFAPKVLYLATGDLTDEQVGALRVLRALLPALEVIVVGEARHEVALRPAAERCGATVLVAPCSPRQISASVEAALASRASGGGDELLDLARGISDEINNPLLFTAGHLQLLEQSLDAADQGRLDQVRLARSGLERIARTMERLRVLTRASSGALASDRVDLAAALDQARRSTGSGAAQVAIAVTGDPQALWVRGDQELLVAMLAELLSVVASLADGGTQGRVALEPGPGTVVVVARVAGTELPAWVLPRTFDPYYVTRVLRQTPHGLSLFLLQTVAHAHGGRATARWLREGGLELRVELPAAG